MVYTTLLYPKRQEVLFPHELAASEVEECISSIPRESDWAADPGPSSNSPLRIPAVGMSLFGWVIWDNCPFLLPHTQSFPGQVLAGLPREEGLHC